MLNKILPFIVKILSLFCIPKKHHDSPSFLIPAYTGLGNFILKTPFIIELSKSFPNSKICILAGNSFGTEFVLKNSKIIDETLILKDNENFFKKVLFYLKIRNRFTHIFLFFDIAPNHPFWGAVLANISTRLGHDFSKFPRWRKMCFTSFQAFQESSHEVDSNFDLLDLLKISFKRNYNNQFISSPNSLKKELEETFREFISDEEYVIVQVSAANGQVSPKKWPLDNFKVLIERLLNLNLKIILLGDRGESNDANKIEKLFKEKILNLTGKTSIEDVAYIIDKASLAITHDSGLMHIANALGTNLIALYGPTNFQRTRPLADTSVVMKLDLGCMPCLIREGWSENNALELCKINHQCMRGLSVDSVEIEVKKCLGLQEK